jgi:hypothetical protein
MSRLPGFPERPWSTALAAGFASAPALTVLGFIMAADLVLAIPPFANNAKDGAPGGRLHLHAV